MTSLKSIFDTGTTNFAPTTLIRNGDTVHVWGCPYAGRKWVPWNWADREGIGAALNVPWVTRCGHCLKKNP